MADNDFSNGFLTPSMWHIDPDSPEGKEAIAHVKLNMGLELMHIAFAVTRDRQDYEALYCNTWLSRKLDRRYKALVKEETAAWTAFINRDSQ